MNVIKYSEVILGYFLAFFNIISNIIRNEKNFYNRKKVNLILNVILKFSSILFQIITILSKGKYHTD